MESQTKQLENIKTIIMAIVPHMENFLKSQMNAKTPNPPLKKEEKK